MSDPTETKPTGEKLDDLITNATANGPVLRDNKKFLEDAESLFGGLYQTWGNGEHIDLVIAAIQGAIALHNSSTAKSDLRTEILVLQGQYLNALLFRTTKKSHADRAVTTFQKALERDPGNVAASAGLVEARNFQFAYLGHRWLLDEAIDVACDAIMKCVSLQIETIDCIIFAALCLSTRAEIDGCLIDLDVAIELLRFGLNYQDFPADALPLLTFMLAGHLAMRYDVAEDKADLTEAKDLIQKGRAGTMPVSKKHDFYKHAVSSEVSRISFIKTRRKSDLFSALEFCKDCVTASFITATSATSKSDSYRRLAQIAREEYYVVWNPFTISTAYRLATSSLSELQKFTKSWASQYAEHEALTTLGEIERSRFDKYGAVDMLNSSIAHFRQSVKLIDLKDSRFRKKAVDIIGVLRLRFTSTRTGVFQKQLDRKEALFWAVQMVKAAPPFRASESVDCMLELGILVEDLNLDNTFSKAEQIELRMRIYRKAAAVEQSALMSRIRCLRTLARTLVDKGDLTKDIQCYEEAQGYLEEIEVLRKKHEYHATGHAPLVARLHLAKFDATGKPEEALAAARMYHRIFNKSNYESMAKAEAAVRYLVMIASLTNDKSTSSKEVLELLSSADQGEMKMDDALVCAIDLWLKMVSRASNRTEQLHFIRLMFQLPAISANMAAKMGHKTGIDILSVYERGRSIIWDRLLNQRVQAGSLEQQHPELFKRYKELNEAVEGARQPDEVFKELPRDRYQAEADLQGVVKEIRQQSGFEDFLFPPLSPDQMLDLSSQGPIVFLVAGTGNTQGYALTISSGTTEVLQLRGYSHDYCQIAYSAFQLVLKHEDSMSEANQAIFYQALQWLWYGAAEPVLQALKLLRTETQSGKDLSELPRIWWITCNWINVLPIHAAGDYQLRKEQGALSTVMDHVVSSYAPTLKALKYARTRMQQLTTKEPTNTSEGYAFLGAMAETPDERPLEQAIPEIEAVKTIVEPELRTTLKSNAHLTRRSAIEHLRTCTIAHLACHGEADMHDPLRTKLLLADWGPKPLRIGLLMRMEMANCQLAYLSACQTAVNRDEKLVEEGLHLSGVFQMAGVPNAIATTWDIDDEEAVKVATGFYQNLKDDESGRLDVRRSARALHRVTRDMRDRGLSPLAWAGYVHFGA